MTSPLPQTPGDQREEHALAAAAAVAAIYGQAETAIISVIASLSRKIASGTMTRAVAAAQLRRTVNAVLSGAAPKARAVLDGAMSGASSRTGGESSAPYIRSLATLLDQAAGNAARSSQGQLADIAAATAKAAAAVTDSGPAGPPGSYGTAIRDAFEKHGGWPGSSLSYRRIQAAQDVLDRLAEQGITGFTDKAGRQWDLTSYAEMATRTAVSSAWDDMQHAAMLRAGIDLAVISTHSTEGSCPHCLPWLGRTISLSGATPGYPTYAEARDSGWRHPNCRCFDIPAGAGIAADVTNPVAIEQAAAVYKASQRQRALERDVRRAGRRASAAITPQARTRARRDLAAARSASAAHRHQTGLRTMKVSARRREHPFRAR